MAATESPLNLVRGPAKKPGWAQLIRLGGDGVAVLFGELRRLIGRIDGVAERLYYSAKEERWVVQYQVGDSELFSVRISPGLLEARMALEPPIVERLLKNRKLRGTVREAIRTAATESGNGFIRIALNDRCRVRAFATLARAKNYLVLTPRRGMRDFPPSQLGTNIKER